MDKKFRFTQEARTNIAVCDGCDARCKIEARSEVIQGEEKYKLFIGGEQVKKYINEYGEEVFLCPMRDQYKCIDLGFKIGKLCDYYKTNTGVKSKSLPKRKQQKAPLQIAENNTEKEILTNDKMRELFGEDYKNIKWFNFNNWRYDDGARIHSTSFDSEVMTTLKQKLSADVRFNQKYELAAVVGMTVGGFDVSGVGDLVLLPKYKAPSMYYGGMTGMVGTIVLRDKQTGRLLSPPNLWICSGRAQCYRDGYMSVKPELEYAKLLVNSNQLYEKMMARQLLVR